MFKDACQKNREGIYGIRSWSPISKTEVANGMGSGFAIAPGIIATVGHLVHINSDPKNKIHSNFHVIRSPDIKQQTEVATLIAEDPNQDIALLKIDKPRSTKFLTLEPNQISTGTSCGSLGFPLGTLTPTPVGMQLGLIERFQGSYISSFRQVPP